MAAVKTAGEDIAQQGMGQITEDVMRFLDYWRMANKSAFSIPFNTPRKRLASGGAT